VSRRRLADLRPVYVVGIGLHPYQRASETTFVELGLRAVREALADAGIEWPDVESAYTGTGLLGMAVSRPMLRHLGGTGIPMAQVENASASGSTAFRQACLEVASGVSDVSLALGVDKPDRFNTASSRTGLRDLVGSRVVPFTHFALLANDYMRRTGATAEQLAWVAVKNSRNGARNPYAQRQRARSLEEVLAPPVISGTLTRLQCCPIGEGAAAVLVASEDGIASLGIDRSRAIRVLSSTSRSEMLSDPERDGDSALTQQTVDQAYAETGLSAEDLDVVEVHDAFTVEELLYAEALGLCRPGDAARAVQAGEFDIGGRCALSPSGGLLSMGHPIGPTGVGQIAEIARQLRHEAGQRQHPNARTGLAHMVGLGAVCLVHILRRG
jgi:acetyl-CoA acetyltransferase